IVLGRAVNSALLVASGLAISSGGPGGALVAHAIAILVVYFVMTSLMEVVSAMPSDMPVYMYGVHLLGQPVGVALAWSHWLSWIVIIVYEISASGLIMEFWLPHVNRAIWCSIFFALCIVIVVVGKRPCIFITRHAVLLFTLCTIIAAIILGAVVAAGGIGGHVYGLENWHKKDPPPFLGGIIGIIGASAFAIFSVQGTEHVVPKVVRAEARLGPLVPVVMCCCLALIFIPSVFVTGLLLPSDSEWFKNVTTGDNASENTFAYIFETAGAKPAAHVINAVLLVSAMLDCCACLCYSADMLQDLAGRGLAPKLLAARCDEQGSATAGLKALLNYSLIATCLVSLGIWIPTAFYTTKALAILAGLIGIGGFITWGSIAAMHCVVRWFKKHRNGELAPPNKRFRALLFPVGPLVCLLYAGGVISG
ncbi:amino acid permease/ SLC12A domain-containing protein, partial [Coemansia spiralis]